MNSRRPIVSLPIPIESGRLEAAWAVESGRQLQRLAESIQDSAVPPFRTPRRQSQVELRCLVPSVSRAELVVQGFRLSPRLPVQFLAAESGQPGIESLRGPRGSL